MKSIVNEISKRLDTLDFDALYPGFKGVQFAIYNSNKVMFIDKEIPWDNRFIGNTSIQYENEYIAIWNIDYKVDDYDVFTSKIVHEMFHAYQLDNGEHRWPNEFEALDYSYTFDNINSKINEVRFLVNDKDIATFKYLRNKRRKLFGSEVQYEEAIETIEGMARFVELEALRQLDLKKYQKEILKLEEQLLTPKNYVPIRWISYEIGAYLMTVAKKKKTCFYHKIGKEKKMIDEIIYEDSFEKVTDEIEIYDLSDIDTYINNIDKAIVDVLNNCTQKVIQRVSGLDPLNTFKVSEFIYFKHFVRYDLNDQVCFEFNESVYDCSSSILSIKK